MLKYSADVNDVVALAQEVAHKYSAEVVGSEHFLYGLVAAQDSLSAKILKSEGVSVEALERFFAKAGGVAGGKKPDMSPRVKNALNMANQVAQMSGASYVDTNHILYCLLLEADSQASLILTNILRADVVRIISKTIESFGGATSIKVNSNGHGKNGNVQAIPPQLKDLGADITQKARDNKIDPIIGRSEEIERIIQILCRKTKNNPVLIGEPGVGKSAIIEGLAKAIAEGKVPELLRDKIIFSLDIGSLLAGTKYRGALEERLKDAVEIIIKQGNIIVFIDEIHTLAQAGSEKGEVSPSDMLKPYLARGELQTIGATTTDEYRKFIEKDKALERRFQPIIVAPPSIEDTITIIKGIRDSYEAYHKVKLSDEAIEAAVNLSDRYIMDRFLPDKAIDLIDEAMSKAKIGSHYTPPEIVVLEDELKELDLQLNEAKRRENYEKCAELKLAKEKVQKSIESVRLEHSRKLETGGMIEAEHIAAIVAKWTKIPVTRLSETEKDRLVNLEQELHRRVIGQDMAVVSVAKSVRRARAGLKDPKRPIGAFLFLGPTGVGKTELTKALAEVMFDDENNIVRLDMSEYMEAHSVSKLIGSPPGYVGHDDGGQLTEAVRRRPYSVVLFDEIEKAHPDVYNALLQIMDEGRLTDSKGRVVNFKNTIIIMTSNVGVDKLKKTSRTLGFGETGEEKEKKKDEEILLSALKDRFKPEFLNRIDVVCIFHHLDRQHIRNIATLMLEGVKTKLAEKGIELALTDKAFEYIVLHGYDSEYGARPLRRVIEQKVEDGLAEAILLGKVNDNTKVTVDILEDGEVVIG